MTASVKMALAAIAAGNLSIENLQVLGSNGCPVNVVTTCLPLLKKLAKGEMLSKPEQDAITAAGGNPDILLGRKTVVVAAPPVVPALVDASVTLVRTGPETLQEVTVENDPFSFILKIPAEKAEQKKALRSLYNSFVSRTQTKIVEGYRAALKAAGIVIEDKEIVSEAMKASRSEIGLDKMLDGVLSKKGFKVSREEQDTTLIEQFRANLFIEGVEISDEQHAQALESGRAFSQAFAERAVKGLKARGLAFA